MAGINNINIIVRSCTRESVSPQCLDSLPGFDVDDVPVICRGIGTTIASYVVRSHVVDGLLHVRGAKDVGGMGRTPS